MALFVRNLVLSALLLIGFVLQGCFEKPVPPLQLGEPVSPVQLNTDSEYSIVFIHVGKTIPSHAQVAVAQARLFNPNASIIMLAPQEALDTFPCASGLQCVPCESLVRGQHHDNFNARTSLDPHSRGGFWLYTSERFLYLADLMNQYGLKDVFHLEYDNMLYADLQELIPIFRSRHQGLAATFDNDERVIPGFTYIKNADAMNGVAKCFAHHAKENLNDMQVLARCETENLPIITQEYIAEHPLKSPAGHIASHPSNYAKNIVDFKSIFDAAAIGQFLGGIDPRNGDSRPGFINESCVFNPSLIKIEWILDEEERRIPYVIYPHAKYRINNLHIHSKRLEQFKSKEAL